MPIWNQLGMMAAGAGVGQILAPINDRRQLRQQEKLQNLQIAGQQQMTDYNLRKQMELWEQTNYKAQVDQLKKAGLNPALLYGHSGPGGSTNLNTGNVGMAQAPQGGGEIMGIMGIGQQAAMTAAQIENIKAQTEKTKAETPNVPLTGKNIQADTALKGQQLENLTTEQGIIAVQRAVQEATQNAQIATIMQNTEAGMKQLEILRNEKEISDANKYERMKQATANLANTIADNALKKAQTDLTGEQKNEVTQKIKNLQQQWDINSIDQEMAKDGMNPNAGSLLKLFHNMLRGLAQMFGR